LYRKLKEFQKMFTISALKSREVPAQRIHRRVPERVQQTDSSEDTRTRRHYAL
jgi:hypothetical protein